ncbi:MAG TPA: carboxymuconolactone decarboxylase family protein [Bryobacteraceae bacterium]|nr:carboxymuconolactone decarboxylase family protein [Bryobacteraceae bacterium]
MNHISQQNELTLQVPPQRLQARDAAPEGYKALYAVEAYLGRSGLEETLLHMVYLRASQMNGCAFCTDMHWKDARAAGVEETKLAMLPVWREAPFFTERERAALEWTEAVTFIAQSRVSDALYRLAREHFSESELVNLTIAVGSMNTWNRLSIAFQKTAGVYKPVPRVRRALAEQGSV